MVVVMMADGGGRLMIGASISYHPFPHRRTERSYPRRLAFVSREARHDCSRGDSRQARLELEQLQGCAADIEHALEIEPTNRSLLQLGERLRAFKEQVRRAASVRERVACKRSVSDCTYAFYATSSELPAARHLRHASSQVAERQRRLLAALSGADSARSFGGGGEDDQEGSGSEPGSAKEEGSESDDDYGSAESAELEDEEQAGELS